MDAKDKQLLLTMISHCDELLETVPECGAVSKIDKYLTIMKSILELQ